MRKTIRKRNDLKLSKEIIYLSITFVICVAIGTYLNKAFEGENIIIDSIKGLNDYYSNGSDIDLEAVVFSNLKENIMFLGSIVLSSLLVITFPVAVVNFLLKGISIGYTINSLILLIKLKSIKMILIIMIKNFIIIPGAILIMAMSFYYIKSVYEQLKLKRKEAILFLGRRYLLNGIIIIALCVLAQLLLNAVSIGILQFLVR